MTDGNRHELSACQAGGEFPDARAGARGVAARRDPRLAALLADCAAIAAHDEDRARPYRSPLGRLQGPEPAAARDCPLCGDRRDCPGCLAAGRERARTRAALVARGAAGRARLTALRARGVAARRAALRRWDADRRALGLCYQLALVALLDAGSTLLEGDALRAALAGWALGEPGLMPRPPAPAPPPPGPDPLERAAAVVEWLVAHHGTRADLATALGEAFVEPAQRARWRPAPPPREPPDTSPAGRERHAQAREQYRAALARAEAERPEHGRALLALALDAWCGPRAADDEGGA